MNSLMNQAATGGGFAVTFSNQDVSNWALTSGHRLERFSIEGQGTVFARLSSTAALNPANLLDGLYVELPEQFTARSNGKAIQVGIVARTARANPAQSFSVIYLTRQAGNSGWQTFSLGAEFQLLTFDFTVPSVPEGYSTKPILSIYGDPAGDGKGVELLGAYVKLKQ